MSNYLWVKPMPLTANKYPPEPTEICMPGIMWKTVKSIADSRQARVSVAYPVALSAVCCVIRGRLFVSRPINSQQELVTLYTASVAGSGEGKSSVRSALLKPVYEVKEHLDKSVAEEMSVWSAQLKAANERRKDIEKQLAAGEPLSKQMKQELIDCDRINGMKPKSGLGVFSDISAEGLIDKMEQCGFVAVHAGEGADLSQFLSAYDDEAKHARACIDLALRPVVLERLLNDADMAGRGFVNRFLIFIARPTGGEINYHREEADTYDAEMDWRDALMRVNDAINSLEDDWELILSLEADRLWADFAQRWQPRLRDNGDLQHLSDFFNKRLAAHVMRLSAVYHMIEGHSIDETISAATMQLAVNAGYLVAAHYIAIHNGQCNLAANKANALLERLEKLDGQTFIKARDVYTNAWGGASNAKEAKALLDVLCEHGYCREVEQERTSQKGRKPGSIYELNPLYFKERKECSAM